MLGPDNAIDLDALGSADLATHINYPGIAEGHAFWPNWRGSGPLGEVIDHVDDRVLIGPGELKPEGMRVEIPNDKLRALDQGQVLYSYRMDDASAPDGRGEESLRRFFHVGKGVSALLPVAQIKESHDCDVDLTLLVGLAGATVVVPPYQAMSVGDQVTLTMKRYFFDGIAWDDFTRRIVLSEPDLGRPLQWTVPLSELEPIEDGSALISYSIVYTTPTVPSHSREQALRIVTPQTPLLPAPRVKDYTGDMLDPEAHPNGITLVIEIYPGIQVGDEVVLYAMGDPKEIKTLRVDPSTVDSQVLQIAVDHGWLSANNGKTVELTYQYARVGRAGTSMPLTLTLRRPLHLPHPEIEGVIRDGEDEEYRGYLLASSITGGVSIKVPAEAVIGSEDTVQMHWEGYGDSGSHVADPTVGDPKRFYIPPRFVPANMGKRLDVFYRVTPPGEPSYKSGVFDLEIKDIVNGWPTLQIRSPASPDNKISLRAVIDEVTFNLANWIFMAQGQRVKITATGLLAVGGEEIFNLREGDAEVVTEEEYLAGALSSRLPRSFLERLRLNQQFDVRVETSFDEGFSYKAFPMISPQLVE
ncbi:MULTISPECIES: hypothetical protein [Pseudomonas]|uniref:hypothetical protein n=1 Tax=Pseudomonas TaxID=286 RepID=UPI001BE78133|nr:MULTISPECIES: hypothetical protein [Pseudomonas]MBT2341801.1 hypothetical protein [Pseudomonas fluorescens]MCD4530472.1 hypothetical protein [Pseudomonas sp. C3-2018]